MAEKTPKRAQNAKKKENRKASWNRAQAKKKANKLANEARRKDNDAILEGLGLSRTVTVIVRGKKKVGRPDSPQRTARLAGFDTALYW